MMYSKDTECSKSKSQVVSLASVVVVWTIVLGVSYSSRCFSRNNIVGFEKLCPLIGNKVKPY